MRLKLSLLAVSRLGSFKARLSRIGLAINRPRFSHSALAANKSFMAVVTSIILFKLLLATLTPLGYDYVLYMSAILENVNFGAWSPWMLMTRSVYGFWLSLPIDHGNLLRAMHLDPTLLLPSHYLLAALVKTPLLVSDIASTFLIYKLATRLGGADTVAEQPCSGWPTLSLPFSWKCGVQSTSYL